MLENPLVVLCILVFLIMCFMIFLWYEKNHKKKTTKAKKPIYTTPNMEGFQVDSKPGSGSGSGYTRNLLQTNRLYDYEYGEWGETLSDSYYDTYELNETYAVLNELSKLKDVKPVEQEVPTFGSSLGAFDTDTAEISWDTDNKSYKSTEVVWGEVSGEASKSIFLKTWLREIAGNVDAMEPCGEQSAHYCYRAPFLNISTTDPKMATGLKIGESAIQAAGGALAAVISVQSSAKTLSLKGFLEIPKAADIKEMYQRIFDKLTVARTPPPASTIKLGRVTKFITQMGAQLKGLGARLLNNLTKSIQKVVKVQLTNAIMRTTTKAVEQQAAVLASAQAVQLLNAGASAVACTASVFTLGLASPACAAAVATAAISTAILTALYIFFGLFGLLMMTIAAIVTPIITSLMDTGGVCPQGTKELKDIMPSAALDFIECFLPIGSVLVPIFSPYICFHSDGRVVLKIPPKLPDFMSDNTLSLTYHAAWQVGYNENIPVADILRYEMDPLPSGFVMIEDSDVKDNSTYTPLITIDKFFGFCPGNTVENGNKCRRKQFLAIETCQGDTVASADGTQCVSKSYNTNVKPASLTPCPSTHPYDDTFNCWKTMVSSDACNAGEIQITPGTSWNDETGYLRVSVINATCANSQGSSDIILAKARAICNNDGDGTQYEKEKDGLVCYAKCKSGYSRAGAICKGGASAKQRATHLVTKKLYKEQKMDTNILNSLSDVTVAYCDFADPMMLDRMAQFYNNYALQNPKGEEDGRITIQRMIGFYGVTASSELSCDVICKIVHITYEPISGAYLSIEEGCSSSYKDDDEFRGLHQCFRRFYFIKGVGDTKGLFTVTGCTFTDYTAPDSMVFTSDPDSNLVHSVPKTWARTDKSVDIVNTQNLEADMSTGRIAAQVGKGLLDVGIVLGVTAVTSRLGAAGGALSAGAKAAITTGGQRAIDAGLKQAIAAGAKAGADAATVAAGKAATRALTRQAVGGMAGGLVGGVGAGMFTSLVLDAKIDEASRSAISPKDSTDAVHTSIVGSKNNLQLVTNANWWRIEHGPIWEQAIGYTPNINLCEGVRISEQQCAHKYVVRNMVNNYHAYNESSHIRQITAIEPRGTDGCYYKFKAVVYDSKTNIEGDIEEDKEIILKHEIGDMLTCTFKPKGTGPATLGVNMFDTNYPIRSYEDPSTKGATGNTKMIYPTREVAYTTDLLARYIRIRPPISVTEGNGLLTLSQISIFDVSGHNISVEKPTYATSTSPLSAQPSIVVNGVLSEASTMQNVWQSATATRTTEYWEVDLKSTVGISEIFYGGYEQRDAAGSSLAGNNKGVRIQFLYTNGPFDTPTYEYVLPDNSSRQFIEVYSSKYMKPKYPLSGAIQIPRPTARTIMLAADQGCINKCEDRGVMDDIMGQYNTNPSNTSTEIVKILRGTTATKDTCEYEAEVFVSDTPDIKDTDGNVVTPGKKSITKQYLSMTLVPKVEKQYIRRILARYVRIKPSFTDGTVLELSNIQVWNAVPDGTSGKMKKGYNISLNKKTTYYNEYYELNEMTPKPPDVAITDGSSMAEPYPNIFKARSNDQDTFFQIDLGDINTGSDTYQSCMGKNSEIYSIDFWGRSDRMPGGIKGISVELYVDVPGDNENCCNGIYAPVFRYYLPNDEEHQVIQISPPALCTFTLTSTEVLSKPYFLQNNTPPLAAIDTSGGVFRFSGIVDTLKNAWNSILPMKSEELVAPINNNIKVSNKLVHDIHDTISSAKTIQGTTKKCTDTDVLAAMMTAYNIAKGPKHTDEFSVEKYTMNRILKSGQATPNTCDVLFEEIYELYDDYIEDITDPEMKGKQISAVRFTMGAVNGNAVPAMDSIVEVGTNALGLMTETSTLSPPYSGPTYAVDCRNQVILGNIKLKLASIFPVVSGKYNVVSNYTKALASFQSTPLSCEYMMLRNDSIKDKLTNRGIDMLDNTTYVKAVFSLASDGKTTTLSSATEYNPENVTYVNNMPYMNGNPVSLPSIYGYDYAKVKSSRVNSTPILL